MKNTDINECQNNDTCDENAVCHDTDGSYWCECLPGFQEDGYSCTGESDRMEDKTQCQSSVVSADINECETLNETCSDENTECINAVGSYSCQCKPGYTSNVYNCTG